MEDGMDDVFWPFAVVFAAGMACGAMMTIFFA